ncbi:MAG: hypothetical protein J6K86_04520 [Clostridia bacterium]|nr:hypothetical protein [Clostridia bacterium]
MKKKLTPILLASLGICCSIGLFSGCNPSKNDDNAENVIVLDMEFKTTYEYVGAVAIQLPTAHVEDEQGEIVALDGITYTVTNADDQSVAPLTSEFASFELGIGNYVITYKYEDLTLQKSFSVCDTVAPEISIVAKSGVYLQELTDGYDFVPAYSAEDITQEDGIDITTKLTFKNANGEEKELTVNAMNGAYQVTEYGVCTFEVTATDAYGNVAKSTTSWKVKDREWQPTSITSGMLADFSEEGYTNYVEAGDTDQYYKITDYSEEYLESFEGANGVLKVEMGFNHAPDYGGYNCIRIHLPAISKIAKSEMTAGKYIAIKMYTEGDINDELILGGNYAATQGDSVTKTSKVLFAGVLPNEQWKTVYIAAEMLNNDFWDTNGDAHYLQLTFSDSPSYKGTNEHMNLYLDSIAIVEELGATTLTMSENKATWTAVDGATAYRVEMNGVTQEVEETEIALDGTAGYIKVTPVCPTAKDGATAVATYGIETNGHASAFTNSVSENLIDSNLTFSEQAILNEQCRGTDFAVQATADGLVVSVNRNKWTGLTAGFRVYLGNAIDASQNEYVNLKFKVSYDKYNDLRIFDQNRVLLAACKLEDKANQIIDLNVDLSSYEGTLTSLQFVFGPAASGPSVSEKLNVTLIDVCGKTDLAIPVLSDNRAEKVISWEAVENAAAYIVSIDGVETETTETSFSYASGIVKGNVQVKAIGKSENLVDSDFTESYYFDARLDNVAMSGFAMDGNNLVWTAVEHKTSYEVKIGDDVHQVTGERFDYSGYADNVFVQVRATGNNEYRDTLWVNLAIISGTVYVVDGYISGLDENNVGWGMDGLIQINHMPLSSFVGDASAGAAANVYGTVTVDGNALASVSASFFNNGNNTFMLSGLGATTNKTVVIEKGTILYQTNENGSFAYVLKEDFELYCAGDWAAICGGFELKQVGWGNNNIVQFGGVDFITTDAEIKGVASLPAISGGEEYSYTVAYHASNVFQIENANFPSDKIITLQKGTVMAYAGIKQAYVLEEDFHIFYSSAKSEWKIIAGTASFNTVGWGNPEVVQLTGVELGFDFTAAEGDGTHSTMDISYVGSITKNGEPLNVSLKYFNENKILMLTASFKAGDVVTLSAGLVLYQDSTKRAYVFDNTMYMVYNGGGEAGSWSKLEMSGEKEISVANGGSATSVKLNVSGLADGEVDLSLVKMISNGSAITDYTATVAGGILTITSEQIDGSFSISAGNVIKQGDSYYMISNSLSMFCVNGNWGVMSGEISANKVASSTGADFAIEAACDFTAGAVDASAVSATLNGNAFTLDGITFENGTLKFSTASHSIVAGDILTIKAGSVFIQNGKFYQLKTDFTVMALGQSPAWDYVVSFQIQKLHWGADWVVQVVAPFDGVTGSDNNEAMTVVSGGVTLSNSEASITAYIYQAATQKVQLQFSGLQVGDVVTIAAKTVFEFKGVKYVLTNGPLSIKWDGANWGLAM